MATDPTSRIMEAPRAAVESVRGGIVDFLRSPLVEIGQTSITPLRIVVTALVLALLWWAVRHGGRRLLHRLVERRTADEKSRYALKRLADIVLTVIGVWLGLELLGVGLGGVMTIFAALGVGIGFGLQNFVKDTISGLILLMDAPIRQGDLIEIDGQTGLVKAIGWRATTILNWDNVEVLVPNHHILDHELINWTLSEPLSRIVVTFGVAYDSDVGAVMAAAEQVAGAQPDLATEPAPIAQLMDFGESRLEFRIVGWTREPWNRVAIAARIRLALVERFRREGIVIPHPQRELRLRGAWPSAQPPVGG